MFAELHPIRSWLSSRLGRRSPFFLTRQRIFIISSPSCWDQRQIVWLSGRPNANTQNPLVDERAGEVPCMRTRIAEGRTDWWNPFGVERELWSAPDPGRSAARQCGVCSGERPGVLRNFCAPALEIGSRLSLDSQITAPWDDQIMLARFEGRQRVIDFGGQLYQQSDVLNRRFESGLRVGCRQVVEGWIFGSGLRPMPADYRDFFVVPCELTLWDFRTRIQPGRKAVPAMRAAASQAVCVPRIRTVRTGRNR